MANENVPDIGANKLKCIVASPGQYAETLRQYAGSTVVVLPHGMDWSPVMDSDNTLEAIITLPLSHAPSPRTVGMDMVPPYGVYVDGVQVAQCDTESEASAYYSRFAVRDGCPTPTQAK